MTLTMTRRTYVLGISTKIAYGICKLYEQGKVLKQWFTILK